MCGGGWGSHWRNPVACTLNTLNRQWALAHTQKIDEKKDFFSTPDYEEKNINA